LLSATHPKIYTLSLKQREEEDLVLRRPFRVYDLQPIQALKAKSSPKQAIKNANQVMEEEDFPFQTPFFSSISKQSKP
jgi:hypothetical protein